MELLQVIIKFKKITGNIQLTLPIDSSAERCTEEHTNKTVFLGSNKTNLTAGR